MHEINKETKEALFAYLQLVWVQVIIENLEFSRTPLGILSTPVYRTQAPNIGILEERL